MLKHFTHALILLLPISINWLANLCTQEFPEKVFNGGILMEGTARVYAFGSLKPLVGGLEIMCIIVSVMLIANTFKHSSKSQIQPFQG